MTTDLTALRSLLQENFREMTRWEVYQSEVESGRLQWGMVHTEKFFKENAQMFEGRDGDFHLLRVSGEPFSNTSETFKFAHSYTLFTRRCISSD